MLTEKEAEELKISISQDAAGGKKQSCQMNIMINF